MGQNKMNAKMMEQ
jgi:hypothetical protein